MTTILLDAQDMTVLRYIHSSKLGALPSYRDIAREAGLANGQQVDTVLDHLIACGYIRQVCCGDLVGLFVRLPGDVGLGKRLTTWTGKSWRDLMTGGTRARTN